MFRFAVATGRAERDPTVDLRGALAPIVVTNHAAITDPVRSASCCAIDAYNGQPATQAAFKLAPSCSFALANFALLDGRNSRWTGPEPEWRIPAERMKMGELHVVPLARQAVAILRDLES